MSTEKTVPIDILIVEDLQNDYDTLQGYIKHEPDMRVVGWATNESKATELASHLQPDIILMDWTLEQGDGLEATRKIHERNPTIRIIIMTISENEDIILNALRRGARGYLLKSASRQKILEAIRTVNEDTNHAIFSPKIARRLITLLTAPKPPSLAAAFPELTKRELEVLELTAAGYSSKKIVQQLTIDYKTVWSHLKNIRSKLMIHERAQLVVEIRDRMQQSQDKAGFTGRYCPSCGQDLLANPEK